MQYLAASALKLCTEYPIEQITVSQICNNCNLSARTFYNHFSDKYALFLWIYTNELDKFFLPDNSERTFSSFMRYAGKVVELHFPFFYSQANYSGQNNLQNSLYEPFYNYYLRIIRETFNEEPSNETHKILEVFVYGMLSYIGTHLKDSDPVPLDEAVDIFCRAIPASLEKYL